MDAVNKALTKLFTWCMILTIMFPVGILFVIFGAVNKYWAMLGCGIAFVVVGFYVMPILWVQYGEKRGYKRIVSAVVVERLTSLKTIAAHLNITEKVALERLDTCIRREYLIGYVREGDLIRLNTKAFGKKASCKCASCGATFEHLITEQAKCPYCRTVADE